MRQRLGRRGRSAALLCIVVAMTATRMPVHAAGDAANGELLARSLCTSCHVVGRETVSGTVAADVPTFVAIAAVQGQTPERIAGRIVIPHPQMPQIPLTRNEIADLATYIMSLKDE